MEKYKPEIGDYVYHEKYGLGTVLITKDPKFIDRYSVAVEFINSSDYYTILKKYCNDGYGHIVQITDLKYLGKNPFFKNGYRIFSLFNKEKAQFLVDSSQKVVLTDSLFDFFWDDVDNTDLWEPISRISIEDCCDDIFEGLDSGCSFWYAVQKLSTSKKSEEIIELTIEEIAEKFSKNPKQIRIKEKE